MLSLFFSLELHTLDTKYSQDICKNGLATKSVTDYFFIFWCYCSKEIKLGDFRLMVESAFYCSF